MKLLLGSCALAALLVGVASGANAQVAVGEAPIHAIPTTDAQPGPQINPPTAPVAAAQTPVAPPAAAPVAVAQAAPTPVPELPPAPAPAAAPAAQPMVMADATPIHAAPASGENALVASLKPPVVQPIALTEDEAAFFTTLGRRVTDAAAAYDGYVRHAAAIDAGFNDPASVQRAVRVGADYQPEQLQQGIVAYAAMIALRNPAFVEGVRAQAQTDPSFADRLAAQPVAILQVPGAAQAAMDVAGVLRAHGVALQTTGKAIGKAAYDIQAQPWSKEPVADPVAVLASVKAAAAQPRAADAPTEKMLLQGLVSAPHLDAYGPPTATPAVVRGMTIAALAIMGRAGDKEDLRVASLLQDALAAQCLKMAMLNMNQCLAAAGPHYDDVFCVGEHAVGETARCVSSAADGGPPQPYPSQRVADLTPPVAPAPAAQAQGAYGPEQAAAYGYAPRPIALEDEAPAAQTPQAEQVADAAPYPQGDGTFNGQIYARRAQMQQQQPQQPPPQYQQASPYQPQPATYAYQDAPPPRQPAPQARAPYPYAYGPSGGGYAPYGGYYAPPAGYAQGYYAQGGGYQ